jgi:hypothetical protein
VVVESLTTTLVPTILPKLQWFSWQGVDFPGGDKGHWGWIPKHCLIQGDWKKSWTERLRTLKLLYRDPDNPDKVIGVSSIQFMSYDQDPTDFASGDYHFVLHDEPPKYSIWRENRARVMRVDGTMMLAMTWPDDPAIPIEWIFDEVYDKGQPGANKDPNVEWINLFTTDNPNLNQSAVAERASQMSDGERQVRILGQPIRFTNRIHPLFTDQIRQWCWSCGKDVFANNHVCPKCSSVTIDFVHVGQLPSERSWPCIYVLDPHPRKPHMMTWTQVTPNDDLEQIAELSVEGGPDEVKKEVDRVEAEFGWHQVRRLIDPNMGRSPSGSQREVTWQDDFDTVGIRCDLADDSEVGRSRLNDYLKPNKDTMQPRWRCDVRNVNTISQLKRYIWDDHKLGIDKDMKQKPRPKNDDFPTCAKYLMNSDPSFRTLKNLGKPFKRLGERSVHGY